MKLQGFPERLTAFIQLRRSMPYAWGTNDCVVFAADAVHAVAGFDPIEGIRGLWNDEATANQILAEQGGLIAATDRLFLRQSSTSFYQRGDICLLLMEPNLTPTLGVCAGPYAAAPGPEGMVLVPMSEVRIIWDV